MSITSRTTVEALPSVISHSTTFNNNNNSFFSPAKLNNSGTAGGEVWEDSTLLEWDSNDYRLFCGDLGNEVTDDMLYKAFSKYSSIQKAKVIRDKRTGKSKGYGFVSFKDADEFVKAWKEMNGIKRLGHMSEAQLDGNHNIIIKILGEGTYGVVYRGKEIATGKIVALKQIRLDDEVEGIPSTSLREISLLKEASRHENMVKLLDIVSQERKMLLVFEYLTKDLKNADGNLKIADFGLARATSVPVKPFTHEVITLYYRAPEILLGSSYYAYQVDIWSIGCIFAEMSNLFPLFPGDSEIDQLYRIFSVLGTPNKIIWPEVICFQDYQTEFPQWNPQPLNKYVPKMDIHAIDLLHINPY
ncbi:7915_t:CDS:10 [Entrophospora sp. SA101]|nr:7915_t:CDS:10 [Entrophospora sp. SA101]